MENERGEFHIETDEARAGSTPHIVRWVLAISLVVAIGLLSIIWITGAVSHDMSEEANRDADRQRQDLNSEIISEDFVNAAPETPAPDDGAMPLTPN